MDETRVVNLLLRDMYDVLGLTHHCKGSECQIAVDYLLANRPFIVECLDWIYTTLTEEERVELCSNHHELELMAATSHHREYAEMALLEASRYHVWPYLNDDWINMLIRALEFAKYSDLNQGRNSNGWELRLHPIKEYLQTS